MGWNRLSPRHQPIFHASWPKSGCQGEIHRTTPEGVDLVIRIIQAIVFTGNIADLYLNERRKPQDVILPIKKPDDP